MDNIDRKDVEVPELGNLSVPEDFNIEKADVSKEDQQVCDEIHSKSGWDKTKEFFKRTWHGENKFGKYLGLGLSISESFLPRWVGRIRNIFQSTTTTMKNSKSTAKSKTVITFGLLFLVGLLQLLGVDVGLELSADAQWVATGVGIVGVLLRLVTNQPVRLGEALGLGK